MVLQFAILIVVGIATAVVYGQTNYAMNESLRFDKEQILLIESGCTAALKAEIIALPGVRGAACSWNAAGGSWRGVVTGPDGADRSNFYLTPLDFGFFEVYGMKPIAGRLFERERGSDEAAPDGATNPPVIINESAMRLLGFVAPNAALGQFVEWRRMLPSRESVNTRPLLPSQIVGVVPDFFTMYAPDPNRPQIFYADMSMSAPYRGDGSVAHAQYLNVKLADMRVPETLRSIDALWDKLGDPDHPIVRRFVDQELQNIYSDVIRQGVLLGVFAGVALFISVLGLFGLAAFTAEQRTKEIGIRKSMGATPRDIVSLMLWQFAKPVLWANIVAWPVAYFVMRRWLDGFANHIDLSPWMFLAASILALIVAVVTVIGHALLVARAQPVTALRYE